MDTDVPTIILFLKRRNDENLGEIQKQIENFTGTDEQEVHIEGIPKPITEYLKLITNGKVSYDSYRKWFSQPDNEDDSKENNFIHQHYLNYSNKRKKSSASNKDFKTKICDEIKGEERKKILHFILAYKQKVLLIKIEDKQVLGYKISKKGFVSLDNTKKDVSITEMEKRTSLYSSDNPDDDSKISTYIRKAFKAFEENNDIDITKLNIPNVDIRIENLQNLLFFNKKNKFKAKIFTTPREFLQEGEIRLGDAVDPFKEGKKKDFQCKKGDIEIHKFNKKNKTKTEKQRITLHNEEGKPSSKENLIIRSKNEKIYPPQKILPLLDSKEFREYMTKNTIGNRYRSDEDWILDYPIKIKEP